MQQDVLIMRVLFPTIPLMMVNSKRLHNFAKRGAAHFERWDSDIGPCQ